jgi:hypothetical protein
MKYLICIGLSLALAQAAVAQERRGGYVGVTLGTFSYEVEAEALDVVLDDSTTTFRFIGGYRVSDNLAIEGGWGKTGGLEESLTLFPSFGLNVGAEYELLTARALGIIPFEKVSLLGGVGFYDANIDITASVPGLGSGSEKTSDSGATLLAGFEFNLERVDVRMELEWFNVDDGEARDFGVGVLFRF